jgi:hypothetical protein
MSNAKIKSMGQFRKFLLNAIVVVRSGDLALDKAAIINKLSCRINESFVAEISAIEHIDKLGQVDELGQTRIV